ncbi:MAG: hypothetical protein DRR16_09055 [Candidatus Parabeggiatoa sp. nov. 3]|nr:MAG: hypothetical protein DRR00_02425 [Gammaproteobacteria bacterium]RKZ69278.1 MAG: hypothetical protein DRQ99_01390 [Gammaproteobacteria bacterium]RKZ86698.1 MAG: hypothetical protein DRR16_09055 [Gammaproteobacteria bacterium]
MYSFSVKLNDNFETAIQRVTEALQKEKLGILNEINVDAVFKKKLDVEIPHYRILHACSPSFAHRLINQEPDIGVLLPCNVLVREETDGTTTVVFMDTAAVFGLTQNAEITPIAEETNAVLMRVCDALK